MPARRAVSTASALAAPTETSKGIPAAHAFWTISKLTRPDTHMSTAPPGSGNPPDGLASNRA